MKKALISMAVLSCLVFGSLSPAAAAPSAPQEESAPTPIYARQIQNGTYEIEVESSSSMFRVIACQLTVQDGQMTAAMTLSGQGYGLVYPGTGEEAAAAPQEAHIPFTLDEAGQKTFTIPIAALDTEVDCAAWSIKKETWYDRVLVFQSDLLPAAAFKAGEIADGTYRVDALLSGGSGRAQIESPAMVQARGGTLMATVVWSSPHYESMLVDSVPYKPVQKEGNSTFLIPIALDEDIAVQALTVAMSEPHLVDYSLRFQRETLRSDGRNGSPGVWLTLAAILLLLAGLFLWQVKKRGSRV